MDYMHKRAKGRKRATPRAVIEQDLEVFIPKELKDPDRFFRAMYARMPICTCPDGLFLPESPEEVKAFKEYMIKGWGHELAHERVKTILAFYPHLAPEYGVQQDLPL
jgi:hypothetical protein